MSLITLVDWNISNYGGKFSINTLRAWARNGNISPAPQKVGRDWLVDRSAEYVRKDRKIIIPDNVDISMQITDPLALAIFQQKRGR